MAACGFKWSAPYIHAPPSKKKTYTPQICVKPAGHKDDHVSISKVTAPNRKEGGE